ncbi:PD-(D/E)XK nuclease family protein [Anatilimnocola sp. NA78]|uniref:PD-(D/E)XK nuclease family protein n=1 Tax=Anatilimnocola sp. NA78 TaxID=3415683 RepID=UPI003CE4DFCC
MKYQFSVSEARTAIACPRIFYFDEVRYRTTKPKTKRLTRIWTGSRGAATGCGTLFHHTIEKFNASAVSAQDVREILTASAAIPVATERSRYLFENLKRFIVQNCLNRKTLASKKVPQQLAFQNAFDQYVGELSDVLSYATGRGKSIEELLREFFGDSRKRVDVTFYVGPKQSPVRVRGALDYIHFDYRSATSRIIDFKLTSSETSSKDLLQASLYSLMHHQQHGTQSDAAVFYLHPERKVFEKPWPKIQQDRSKVFDLLHSMARWSDYDETTGQGLKPPGEPALCHACPWNKNGECEKRLGPKQSGERAEPWAEEMSQAKPTEPKIQHHTPPAAAAPPVSFDEFESDEAEDDVAVSAADLPQPPKQPIKPAKPAKPNKKEKASAAAPANELRVGTTSASGHSVVVPSAALTTHASVVGAAGSGKSWLAKVLVEEAVLCGIPILAIDPQGDLVQFLRPSALGDSATEEDRRGQDLFRDRAEVRVWTPGTSHGQRLCLSPIKLPKPADLQGIESPQRRQEEWESLVGIAAGSLVQLAQAGGDQETQNTFLNEILKHLSRKTTASNELQLAEIIAGIAAPDSLGIDDADKMISKRDRSKLEQKLFTRMRGPTSNLFTGGIPLDLERFIRPVTPGRTPLNVVYLNAMPDDDQKQYFVAALAGEIYRWMITSFSSGNVRLLVFLDEARDFLPAGARKPPAKEPLLRLFAQGRKFGVSCLICTQSPRSVDYQIFSNASTKFIGRLEAAQDVSRVAEWFKDSSGAPTWLDGRKGAKPGSMIGRWPGITPQLEGQEFRSRPLYSLHEGAWSPDRLEQEWLQSPLAGRLDTADE